MLVSMGLPGHRGDTCTRKVCRGSVRENRAGLFACGCAPALCSPMFVYMLCVPTIFPYCPLCGDPRDDLYHRLWECSAVEGEREKLFSPWVRARAAKWGRSDPRCQGWLFHPPLVSGRTAPRITFWHGETQVQERSFKPIVAKDGPIALGGSCMRGSERGLATASACVVQVLRASRFEERPVVVKKILATFAGDVWHSAAVGSMQEHPS